MKLPDSWVLAFSGVAMSLSGVILAALILLSGAADPPVARELLWEDHNLAWAGGTEPVLLNQKRLFFDAPMQLPADGFSLVVHGDLLAAGPTLATWGIWIAIDENTRLLIGINGFQYVTARYCPVDRDIVLLLCQPLTEPLQQIETVWKYFHLIKPINLINRMELHYLPDRQPQRLSLRFDGEYMWHLQFEKPLSSPGWGVWAENTGATRSHVRWTSAHIHANIR